MHHGVVDADAGDTGIGRGRPARVVVQEVIANQLWDDTPPEVWQAAQRLLAEGHDRHAVLHALAYELGEELYPALTGQHAPDPDMTAYRKRLRQL